MSKLEDVIEFHEQFRIPIKTTSLDDLERVDLRLDLIEEEFRELVEAVDNGDRVGILDALIDLEYVTIGMGVELFGDSTEEAWDRVHESNMNKLDPETGEPIYREDGKVMKPEGWEPPFLDDLV